MPDQSASKIEVLAESLRTLHKVRALKVPFVTYLFEMANLALIDSLTPEERKAVDREITKAHLHR